MLFDLYWRVLGLPLSRLKGLVTDAVPFSLVEASLWMGAVATIAWIMAFWPRARRGPLARAGARRTAFVLGPVFLVALGLGQGAFPFAIAPTALREPLAERLAQGGGRLSEAGFKEWAAAQEKDLRASLSSPEEWRAFQALTEQEVLRACDTLIDQDLAALRLPPGRAVRAYKTMGPATTAMGLLYGGPAFHDPFFGEIGIISPTAYPSPRYWRLIAACHETAHAKGFTREMDAEVLTHLALRRGDRRLMTLGNIHFLRKTGLEIEWPDSLVADARRAAEARARVEASRPVLRRLKAWLRGTPLQNSGTKYGVRREAEAWDPAHPFFATIRHARDLEARGEPGSAP